jgi:carbon storage regulator
MLVLSRKLNERVRVTIGGEVLYVAVVEIEAGKVRLGFEADRSIEVLREELVPAEDPGT